MSLMSEFEVRANNIQTGIGGVRSRIDQFGYSEDEASESVSRIVAMFVSYLTACEEARHTEVSPGASFTSSVLNRLPELDDPNWSSYIRPEPRSSLKRRVESLWGIRIAFTHADGDTSLISNSRNRQYAINAPSHLEGVTIEGDILKLNEGIFHVAIRTMVQVQDVLA